MATDGAAALPAADADALVRMEFTVHGRVQKVHFRRYTKRRATELGVAGWVKNTAQHTVVGVAEGRRADVDALRHWLATVGSPKSRIARLEASPLAPIEERKFDHFRVDETFGYAPNAPNAAKAQRRAARRAACRDAPDAARPAKAQPHASAVEPAYFGSAHVPALRIGVTYGAPPWGHGSPMPPILRGYWGALRPSGGPQTHSKSRLTCRHHIGTERSYWALHTTRPAVPRALGLCML
jgi:acylphosphatase